MDRSKTGESFKCDHTTRMTEHVTRTIACTLLLLYVLLPDVRFIELQCRQYHVKH